MTDSIKNEIPSKKRVYFIDYAKAIGIYLVVLGHLPINLTLRSLIYAFHMPLFFFLSGYLFSFSKYQSIKQFAIHRAKQLLIPYITFNVVTYLFWLFIGRKFGDDATAHLDLLKPVIGIFYGNGNNDFLIHDQMLWFLPCLFVAENIFFVIGKNQTKKVLSILIIASAILAFLYYKYGNFHMIWGADTALAAIMFYGTANVLKKEVNKMSNFNGFYKVGLVIFLSVAFVITAMYNGTVDMMDFNFNNFAIFVITAFLGIVTVILASQILSSLFGKNKLIEYVSMNTLIIMAFHSLAFTFIKGLLVYILKLSPAMIKNNLLIDNIVATLSILSLTPLIYLSGKYFPFLVGKKPARVK